MRSGDLPYYANNEDKTSVKDEIAYIEIKTKLLMKSKKKIDAFNLISCLEKSEAHNVRETCENLRG